MYAYTQQLEPSSNTNSGNNVGFTIERHRRFGSICFCVTYMIFFQTISIFLGIRGLKVAIFEKEIKDIECSTNCYVFQFFYRHCKYIKEALFAETTIYHYILVDFQLF